LSKTFTSALQDCKNKIGVEYIANVADAMLACGAA